MHGPEGQRTAVAYRLRIRCDDALMVRSCVLAGSGVAALPLPLCRSDLEQGRLVRVLPDWHIRSGTLSIALPSRQGLTPAVRATVGFLVSALPAYLSD
ncbi:LysR substrate-binding domain-containing protein [Paraburkholderia sp. BL10I2N1]|uniref:LysR substrate-binding domain-containing protein n=1 Tax=Paraburkholderia sp. BL10I2N1 TaxID=1938796 RepID=UPI0024415105|nr:LysR substrate-binding domain-containing protein [Paraburkholderia sp. BL10I2N1]